MDEILLGNPLIDWLYAAGVAAGLVIIAALVRWLIVHRLTAVAGRTAGVLDDSVVDALRSTRLWLLIVPAIYVGSKYLDLPERMVTLMAVAATLALLVQAGLWLSRLLEFWIGKSQQRAPALDAPATTGLSVLRFIGRTIVWATVLLLALDNVGVNVTALIAGLGVGGIAVALAAQNILGDLFASLSIVIDKPFVIGDSIVVDDAQGTVEHVGLKTTRIRSLSGEQIVIANGDLLKSRIRNYQQMRERRVLFGFGVLYETPPDKVARIPGIVGEIIGALAAARLERAHFKELGESAYNFEVVYWVLDPGYKKYMDVQQAINLQLVHAFAKEGIGFAFPTRTVHVEGPIVIATGPR
ncbi:MAG: mechanosensitive ion channel family protein [Gammaproteobacteria bacterium]|nr:mechanosensitive ion channel family protein [Gammaproteobacteria bacterium]